MQFDVRNGSLDARPAHPGCKVCEAVNAGASHSRLSPLPQTSAPWRSAGDIMHCPRHTNNLTRCYAHFSVSINCMVWSGTLVCRDFTRVCRVVVRVKNKKPGSFRLKEKQELLFCFPVQSTNSLVYGWLVQTAIMWIIVTPAINQQVQCTCHGRRMRKEELSDRAGERPAANGDAMTGTAMAMQHKTYCDVSLMVTSFKIFLSRETDMKLNVSEYFEIIYSCRYFLCAEHV